MKKKIAKRIVLSALLMALLVLAACSSVPKAPDFNALADSQDMRFMGEWKADGNYIYVLNADGTGEHIYILSNGERSTSDVFNWRTTETWLSLLFGRGSQVTRPYLFSDDDQTVTFADSRQLNGFNTGIRSWTKVIGEY